mgnify:CR=1 FL=1
MPLLEVRDLRKHFGGIAAVDGVTFDVAEGKVVGLIGPNGAGKTTVFNLISRLYDPDGGSIRFQGQDLLRLAPHQVLEAGIARTFQNVELFRSMTVLDNVLVAASCRLRVGVLEALLRPPWVGRKEREARERALELLSFLGLEGVAQMPAGALPFAVQKKVEIARGLVAQPRLLLLDEPASGLNHEELMALGETIRSICRRMGGDGAAGGAPHEPGDGHLRPRGGAELRAQDRRGVAGGGGPQPGRHRGLPGGAGGCCGLRG